MFYFFFFKAQVTFLQPSPKLSQRPEPKPYAALIPWTFRCEKSTINPKSKHKGFESNCRAKKIISIVLQHFRLHKAAIKFCLTCPSKSSWCLQARGDCVIEGRGWLGCWPASVSSSRTAAMAAPLTACSLLFFNFTITLYNLDTNICNWWCHVHPLSK